MTCKAVWHAIRHIPKHLFPSIPWLDIIYLNFTSSYSLRGHVEYSDLNKFRSSHRILSELRKWDSKVKNSKWWFPTNIYINVKKKIVIFAQLQRSVEYLCKDRGQLVSTDFKSGRWNTVWSWSFPRFCFLKMVTSSTQTLSAGRMVGKGGMRGGGGGGGGVCECVKCRSEHVQIRACAGGVFECVKCRSERVLVVSRQ